MTGPGPLGPPLEAPDAVATLRAYQPEARWTLRELARVAGFLLEHAGLPGAALPTDRTIRFYVARGLLRAPAGRGPAAVYGYRQLVEVLVVKLRQADGAALEALRAEVPAAPLEVLESEVARRVGVWIPPVERLRALLTDAPGSPPAPPAAPSGTLVRRIAIEPGVELLVELAHPLARLPGGEARLAEGVRRALASLRAGPPAALPAPQSGDSSWV